MVARPIDFDAVIRRVLKSQRYRLAPEELKAWRLQQPGSFKARNGQECNGWTQAQAARWMGVNTRTWQSWEGAEGLKKSYPAPIWAVRRIIDHSMSLDQKLEEILAR